MSANAKENEPANQIADAVPAVEIKSVEAVAMSQEATLEARPSGRLIQDGIERIADGMAD